MDEEMKAAIVWWIVLIIALVSLLCGCAGVQYVPIEKTVKDSVIVRDTVLVEKLIPYKDSVNIEGTKGEDGKKTASSFLFNPYGYSWAKWDGDNLSHSLGIFTNTKIEFDFSWFDRVKVIKEDVPYPVEKELSRWEEFKIKSFGFLIPYSLLVTFLLGLFAWLKFKKKII